MKRENLFYPGCFVESYGSIAVSKQAMGQLCLFGKSIEIGLIFGSIYQLFWLIRKLVPHNELAVFLEDFCYLAVVSVKIIGFFAQTSKGAVCWYSVMGILIGSVIIEKTRCKIVQVFGKISLKKG